MKDTQQRFSSSGKKSDTFDAFRPAEHARTDVHGHTPLRPDSDLTRTLRALTRVRATLVKDRVVLAYWLSDQLETFWPSAGRVFHAIDTPIPGLSMSMTPLTGEAIDTTHFAYSAVPGCASSGAAARTKFPTTLPNTAVGVGCSPQETTSLAPDSLQRPSRSSLSSSPAACSLGRPRSYWREARAARPTLTTVARRGLRPNAHYRETSKTLRSPPVGRRRWTATFSEPSARCRLCHRVGL